VTVTWEDALADCESRLDAAAAALELGKPVALVPFAEPQIADPLPAELEARARACSERGLDLEQRFAGELERVRVELRRLPRMPRTQGAARFDAQA
jgi:hypothetical protein